MVTLRVQMNHSKLCNLCGPPQMAHLRSGVVLIFHLSLYLYQNNSDLYESHGSILDGHPCVQ